MKLLLDEMLSPAIAAALRDRGHDAVAIKERADWHALPDSDVVAVARHERRAIVTTNIRDFRPLHTELVVAGGLGHYGMIFIPTGVRLTKATTGQIVTALEAILAAHPGDEDLAHAETWL